MNQFRHPAHSCTLQSPFREAVGAYWTENPVQSVFVALAEKIDRVPAFEREVLLDPNELWKMHTMTGIDSDKLTAELRVISVPIYWGTVEAYDPSEQCFWLSEGACVWQYFAGCILFRFCDLQKFKAFVRQKSSEAYAVSPSVRQQYESVVFDFDTDTVRKDGICIKKLGEKSSKLARFLLENRNRRFSYAELATLLGEERLQQDYRSSFSYARSLDKIFERLNRACGVKIFHCKNDSVIIPEPCRENVGAV